MTLVETMSPSVTPSVDCVLNRNGGEVRGPRARAMQHLSAGRSPRRGSAGRMNSGELCGLLCQYQVTRTAARGLGGERSSSCLLQDHFLQGAAEHGHFLP